MHLRPFGQRVVLGVLDDRQVERRGVLEGAPHDLAAGDAAPVVADGDGAGGLQVGHLGELLAALPDGDGADRVETHAVPTARALATSISVTTRESLTGRVLGMQHTSTNPPAAAARRPLATSSLPSAPGSRRCAWRSMRPGKSQAPGRSTTRTRSLAEEVGGRVATDARDDAALDDHVDLRVERAGRVDGAHAAEDDGFGHGRQARL